MHANSEALLNDIFTLVAYLNAHDFAARHGRFLGARAVAQLNGLMHCPDPIRDERGKQRSGQGANRHGARTELGTERVRWIHFLAEAGGLVARTGNLLKPTARFGLWLNAAPRQRLQTVFDAAFPLHFSDSHWNLWRAYRLPGYRFKSAGVLVEPLMALLRELPPQTSFRPTSLLKLLALPTFDDDDPQEQPGELVRALLTLLVGFDAVRPGRNTFELTAQGSALLHHKPLKRQARIRKTRPIWQKPRGASDAPILIEADSLPLPVLYELVQFAEPEMVRRKQPHDETASARTRQYRLDAPLIHRALDHGVTLAAIRDFLGALTAAPLPLRVSQWLDANTRHYGQVMLQRATLLTVKDPAHLTELARSGQIRECFQQTLSSRAVIVKPTRVQNLVRRLKWRGEQPRLDAALRLQTLPGTAPKQFDNPTLAQLYLSAQLVHHLAEVIPAQYRPAYSVLLDLKKQLAGRDVEAVTALVEQFCAEAERKQKSRAHRSLPEAIERDFASAAANVTSNLSQIQITLAHSAPLQMTYYSPYTDETTTRVVEPLRVEYRDEAAYLIGYCRLDRAERTFRVDRILEIESGE